jgi:hypothetical protein
MAKKGMDSDSSGVRFKTLGDTKRHSGNEQLHVTAGGVLTPVLGFRGQGVTGMPPAPKARGFTNEPGDGPIPGGNRKAGGNNALKAFGLNGSGQNEK